MDLPLGLYVWEFPLDWKAPPLDRLEWLTDVISSYDNHEERAGLRQEPRRTLEVGFTVKTDRLGRLDALVYGAGSQDYLIPEWMDATELTLALVTGHDVLECDPSNRNFTEGSYILIGDDPSNFIVSQIEFVGSTYIGLTEGLVLPETLPLGTKIYPARICKLISPARQQQVSAGVLTMRATFQVDDQPFYSGIPTGTSFGGVQVFLRSHNWADNIQRDYDRSLDILDSSTNTPRWIDKSGFAQITRSGKFVLRDRADRWAFIQWLYSILGRLMPFWKEDRESVIQLSPRQGTTTTSSLHMLPFGFVEFLKSQPCRTAIILRHIDGSIYYRNIVDAGVDGTSGDEVLTLDSSIRGSVPSDWLLISYMELVRLSADAVEIAHEAATVAQVAVSFIGVRQ